jgi:hypothetical protein
MVTFPTLVLPTVLTMLAIALPVAGRALAMAVAVRIADEWLQERSGCCSWTDDRVETDALRSPIANAAIVKPAVALTAQIRIAVARRSIALRILEAGRHARIVVRTARARAIGGRVTRRRLLTNGRRAWIHLLAIRETVPVVRCTRACTIEIRVARWLRQSGRTALVAGYAGRDAGRVVCRARACAVHVRIARGSEWRQR